MIARRSKEPVLDFDQIVAARGSGTVFASVVAQGKAMTPGLIDEIIFIDLLALVLSVATVEIVWYAAKKALPAEVADLQFFVIFILLIVPFVMLIYFGLAVINYDRVATWSGWPQVLPLKSALSPPLVGATIFYIGQTLWLWSAWRNERTSPFKGDPTRHRSAT